MIIDLAERAGGSYSTDICIVGAGPAGIALATRLESLGLSTILIEGGGHVFSSESQQLYRGVNAGDKYFPLDACRLRFFGGSSNHWGGWCRPFEDHDFSRINFGGSLKWPVDNSSLTQYLPDACKFLDVECDYTDTSHDKLSGIRGIRFNFSTPTRVGPKYKDRIEASGRIVTLLNATLCGFRQIGNGIQSLEFKNYSDKSFKVSAGKFVLAMGGIENSRYLLWMVKTGAFPLLRGSFLAGRYWMEHPHLDVGEAIVDKSVSAQRYFCLDSAAQSKLGILGAGIRVERQGASEAKRLVSDLLCVAPKLGAKLLSLVEKELYCGTKLRVASEQMPLIDNRVELLSEVDRFGIPIVKLNWVKTTYDLLTVKKTLNQFSDYLIANGLGRIKVNEGIRFGEWPVTGELAGNHHLGGTRMGFSASDGVVDDQCRVFGCRNLYIAGSSIFRTGGINNPTLAIVQFALRLADHLVATKNV